MNFFPMMVTLSLLLGHWFLTPNFALAQGSIGVSPAEVRATILQGEQSEIIFNLSRESISSEETFVVTAEDETYLEFPEGRSITLGIGIRSMEFPVIIKGDSADFGDYQSNLNFQSDRLIDGQGGVQVYLGVRVDLNWRVVDEANFGAFLADDVIRLSELKIEDDIIAKTRFDLSFHISNNSADEISGLTCQAELLGPDGTVIETVDVQADHDLQAYEDHLFETTMRVREPGLYHLNVRVYFNGSPITQSQTDFTVRAKGLPEYALLIAQLGLVVVVLVILAIARKKEGIDLP